MHGFAANDDLNGMADDDLRGIGSEDTVNGYVRDRGVNGVDAFIPERPRETPGFSPSPNAPMWARSGNRTDSMGEERCDTDHWVKAAEQWRPTNRAHRAAQRPLASKKSRTTTSRRSS
jgi:hypothetical protein